MNEREIFEAGCFSPEWTTDDSSISKVHTMRNKDLKTLLDELDQIKEQIQEIQAKQWHIAKLIRFHQNGLVNEWRLPDLHYVRHITKFLP